MTSHELKLLDMGARLYARQVLARAELREERAERKRLLAERSAEFWRNVRDEGRFSNNTLPFDRTRMF